MQERRWTVADCFVGPSCWCRTILDPDGVEVIPYSLIHRDACRAIVDAMNGHPGDHSRIFTIFPIPWHVKQFDDGSAIVTTEGLTSDDMEGCVCPAAISHEIATSIVEAVNAMKVPQ